MLTRFVVLGALAASGVGASSAQTPADYLAQARLAWAAFRCEQFAETASLDEPSGDNGRLFAVGYRAAQAVFQARHQGLDVGKQPASFAVNEFALWVRLGPTSEYDVGSFHAFVVSFAQNEIGNRVTGDPEGTDYSKRKPAALRLYNDANCDFVGR